MQLVVNQVLNNIFYPTLMNAGSGEVDGIELEAAFQLTESLRLRANLSRLRTEFDELLAGGRNYKGYGFARVPQTTALLGIDYRTPLAGGTLALGTDWSYTSKHHFNVTDDSDLYALQQAYWLGSVHASYTLPGDQVIIGAYVNNVTDRRYKNQAMLYQGHRRHQRPLSDRLRRSAHLRRQPGLQILSDIKHPFHIDRENDMVTVFPEKPSNRATTALSCGRATSSRNVSAMGRDNCRWREAAIA